MSNFPNPQKLYIEALYTFKMCTLFFVKVFLKTHNISTKTCVHFLNRISNCMT